MRLLGDIDVMDAGSINLKQVWYEIDFILKFNIVQVIQVKNKKRGTKRIIHFLNTIVINVKEPVYQLNNKTIG